jgi:uncharacterized protein (DUF1330 family)
MSPRPPRVLVHFPAVPPVYDVTRAALALFQEARPKGGSMPGYLIANLDVKDAATFSAYREQVEPVLKRYGARYLVRGGAIETLEGGLPLKRLVVLEFPTLDAARRFYHSADYAAVKHLRHASVSSDLFLVDGYSG